MNRRFTRLTAAAFVAVTGAAIGFVAPAAGQSGDLSSNFSGGSSGSVCPPAVEVSPDSTAGWINLDGRRPDFVEGPGRPSGDGSIELTTSDDPNDRVNYTHFGYLRPLSEVADGKLGWTYWGAVAFQLTIYRAIGGGTGGYSTLRFEPAQYPEEWTTDNDLAAGNWLSTRDIAGAPVNTYATLHEISQANPDAVVASLAVQVGSGQPNATAYVDTIQYGCDKWEFEPTVLDTGSNGSGGSTVINGGNGSGG
ncbi:hypothetical protein OG921_23345 [Aldersonia sp. NBC_00410]|uniref:hypothetical protein n=1 Tax=Aldersonia sp. NBC_00410 TaxID=2975954 RepID=UPI00225862F0|nr:hypothetical protein [Aldersonia sp. NBC_00410]MCX5046110.1 hypothetical protein [Aldersonia sp. NBC_00410]